MDACTIVLTYTMLCNDPSAPIILLRRGVPSFGHNLADFGNSPPNFRANWAVWAQFPSISAKLLRSRPKLVRIRPSVAEFSPDLFEVWAKSTKSIKVGRDRPNRWPEFGQTWHNTDRLWSISAKVGRIRPKSGPTQTYTDQIGFGPIVVRTIWAY